MEGLEFPLAGYTPYTAPISSVFDHTMTDGNGLIAPYKKDHVVTAYTGEEGAGEVNEHRVDPTCIRNASGNNFSVNDQYDAPSICTDNTYLSYDGHPDIDYALANVPVYPVANGTVVSGRCVMYFSGGTTCVQWGAIGIDHGNGYITQYWHMREIEVEAGMRVTTDTVLGTASNTSPPGVSLGSHLHFEIGQMVNGNYTLVDPYGWTGGYADPYRVKAMSVPLWK